jgi:lysozyme
MNILHIHDIVTKHIGIHLKTYTTSQNIIQIGVNRDLVNQGISREEALYLLNNDIQSCIYDLKTWVYPFQFDKFPEHIQDAIISMRFMLGTVEYSNFKDMIVYLRDFNYKKAAKEIEKSKWAIQYPERSKEIINLFLKGE